MDNRRLLWLNVVPFLLGIYLSIHFFYSEEPNLFYGAFGYLIASSLFFISAILFKNLSADLKLINSVMITLYMIHGIIMVLICFYASPTDHFELAVSTYFFIGAMLAGSTLSFQKMILSNKIEISGLHKIIRLALLVIIALIAFPMVYTILMTGIKLVMYYV